MILSYQQVGQRSAVAVTQVVLEMIYLWQCESFTPSFSQRVQKHVTEVTRSEKTKQQMTKSVIDKFNSRLRLGYNTAFF